MNFLTILATIFLISSYSVQSQNSVGSQGNLNPPVRVFEELTGGDRVIGKIFHSSKKETTHNNGAFDKNKYFWISCSTSLNVSIDSPKKLNNCSTFKINFAEEKEGNDASKKLSEINELILVKSVPLGSKEIAEQMTRYQLRKINNRYWGGNGEIIVPSWGMYLVSDEFIDGFFSDNPNEDGTAVFSIFLGLPFWGISIVTGFALDVVKFAPYLAIKSSSYGIQVAHTKTVIKKCVKQLFNIKKKGKFKNIHSKYYEAFKEGVMESHQL